MDLCRHLNRALSRATLLLALQVLLPSPASAWGWRAHLLVNDLALEALADGPLKAVLLGDRRQVVRAALEPDDVFRHAYPELEAERHFMNIDGLAPAPFLGLPETHEALAACRLRPPLKPGRLPLAVREYYDELVRYLRAGDELSSRRVAGLLGHYVADATMPLHATTNFDGWETGNRGIHFLLEVTFYEWDRRDIERAVGRSRGLGSSLPADPEDLILALLREGHAHVPELMRIDDAAQEKGGHLDGRSPRVLEKRATPVIAAQVARAADALALLWAAAEREWQASPSSRSTP